MKTNLKIYKDSNDAVIPTVNNSTDAGLDLYSIEEVVIKPNERKLVPIGLRIVCDKGWYYTFAPRSGMAFKSNIVPSHHNVMDAFYTGNCDVLMHNRSGEEYTIKKGDKFCQIILHEVPEIVIEVITKEELDVIAEGSRGDNGMGSSGK